MTKTIIKFSIFILSSFISVALTAQSNSIEEQVTQALAAPYRTDNDRHADTYRLPAATLAFFGLKNNMRVIELIPGRGYYTKILGQVLADNGKLYLGAGANNVAEELPKWGLNKVEIMDDNFDMSRGAQRGYNVVNSVEFKERNVDMVLTFRNMHNMAPESRKLLNIEVFKALKSGGIYGIIDHTRRHMEPYIEQRWRRVDPVGLIKELQELGFVFVDHSDLHYRPNDSLTLDSTDESIGRDSDRFTMKFLKP
ncbi:MAG: class I SAM-dependent methyltransferase [Gammaproteobacteria bacterium]|jgi:predicted methyltransferase